MQQAKIQASQTTFVALVVLLAYLLRMSSLTPSSAEEKSSVVLVTGATGTIGKEVVSLLAHTTGSAVSEIRIGTRNPSGGTAQHLQAFDPSRVRPVALDFADQNSVDDAVKGVDVVMFIADFAPATTQALISAIQHDEGNKAPFIVKISVLGARLPKEGEEISFFPKMHGLSEAALEDAGLSVACIQPTALAKHLSFMNPVVYKQGDNHLYLPIGDEGMAFVDYRDVAALMVGIGLDSDRVAKHAGKKYPLTGPTAPKAAEIAAWMSAAGKQDVLLHTDPDEYDANALKILGKASPLAVVYREGAAGHFAPIHGQEDFERIVGRKTGTIARYIMDRAPVYMKRNED